ncbi:MAG TPA: hypothetical protein VKR06_45365 [Ktedonosporobacter sp.]|nr:hypothetical protein [Ktedonosporobacter sp.]
MNTPWLQKYSIIPIMTCIFLLTSCSWFGGGDQTSTVNTHPGVDSAVLDILNNIKQNGFNSDSNINNGMGGLYINWRYGTNPLETDVNGSGQTDAATGATLRHDPLTEARYIHNLWLYKSQHPNDSSFDSEIARYTPIIKQEFAGTHSEDGWLYDLFAETYQLSHDSFYQDTAKSLAQGYAKAFKPQIGSIVKINSTSPEGTYRADLVLESGCALVQAGTQFNNPQWTQDGMSIINFVYTHAYLSQYHTFPNQLSQVVLPDHTASPQETFYTGQTAKNGNVVGGQVRMGALSQIVISLLDTYKTTNNQDFLNKATDLLDPFALPANTFGMWDTQKGGYYSSLQFTGQSPTQPGDTKVVKTTKEAGRQADMLLAFHLANKATNGRYKDMEQQMLNVSLNNIYIPSIHGSTYIVNADWSFQKFKNGQLNNMVTTEAMGAELEALLGLNR